MTEEEGERGREREIKEDRGREGVRERGRERKRERGSDGMRESVREEGFLDAVMYDTS